MRLQRSAELMTGNTAAFKIDNLRYDYTGNRLTKVTEEEIEKSEGYPYLASHNTIEYDNNLANGNGNMTKHLDKGISSIQYNYLNLPKQITQNAQITNYVYRADGVKVKKLFGDIETNYLDGFQYKALKPSQENPGGLIGPDDVAVMKLRIIPTSEGYFDAITNQYIYNYTDHLGNIRLSYTDTNKDGIIQPRQYFVSECDGNWNPPFEFPTCIDNWKPGEIVEVNNYYPFGLMHNYTATTQNAYQYKYNDKELQETGMYDYGARFYMPDIGRWGVIDPMAEKYRRWSPYNYAVNNPIMFIDPDGRDVTAYQDAAVSLGKSLQAQARADNAANEGKTDEISFFGEGDWIPEIQGGRLVAKMEAGDTAASLARFLNADQRTADKLFAGMKKGTVDIPESIEGVKAINNAISDALVNPTKYKNSLYLPDSWEDNYNCFTSTQSISKGQSPIDGDVMSNFGYSNSLKKDYYTVQSSEYKFAHTSIRFGKDEKNILGMSSNFSTHAATYLGTSKNGTIYTWSKNGTVGIPGVVKLSTLESYYGKNQGVGSTKNETGFYNRR